MRLAIKTIWLLLIWAYPLGLAAQVVPYNTPASPSGETATAGYQADAAAKTSPDTSPSLPPQKAQSGIERPEQPKKPGGLQQIITVVASLAVVLGIFFLVAWLLRRASPNGSVLPAEAFEVLGRAALANRQQVQLLRCGNKLLLVCVSMGGATTLTEIGDPAEVERLSTLCRQSRAGGAAALGNLLRRGGNRDA